MPEIKISPWSIEPSNEIISINKLNQLLQAAKGKKKTKLKRKVPPKSKTVPESPMSKTRCLSAKRIELKHSKTQIKFQYPPKQRPQTALKRNFRVAKSSSSLSKHVEREDSFTSLSIGRKNPEDSNVKGRMLLNKHITTELAIERKLYVLKNGIKTSKQNDKFNSILRRLWKGS